MKKIFKSLSLSLVIAFTMSITPMLSTFNNSNVSVVEATSKKIFKTFTVNSVYNSSTRITGRGTSGATIKAYVNGSLIGTSKVSSSGSYSIRISQKRKNTRITVKISKSGYTSKSRTVTVKSSSHSNSSSLNYVYANSGKYTSNIYHKSAKAHNMEGAKKMTLSQAKSRGYRACKVCWR